VTPLWADLFSETLHGRTILHAMPLMLGVLCVLAIAYRYYSAFLAARVAVLDNRRLTPAHQFNDGQNYDPTNKWVLFGHHFAAISGAGPLIGPVLAIQYGYMPGLLWLVIGVCLAGAVQDMLVLAASVRRGGKSLAEIARSELGPWASIVVSAAILFIVIIALAGLGFVVVKALGGEEVKLPAGMEIQLPESKEAIREVGTTTSILRFPEGCRIRYDGSQPLRERPEAFVLREPLFPDSNKLPREFPPGSRVLLPEGFVQLVPGSSWGVFTIACTIPIALFVGLWMYKIRKGKIVEASLLGAAGVIAATVVGNWIPGSPLEPYFSFSRQGAVWALTIYGFIAAVLPVWLLLCPRDYISSFLKIGTIGLLVIGVLVANPSLPCPLVNETFLHGGPTFAGSIFPFVFICIMCGSISGFHALVSSGTTPKMIDKESHIRPIGYGAMLMEGLVGVVALIAAASMPPDLYYDINVDLDRAGSFQSKLDAMYSELGIDRAASADLLHAAGVDNLAHLDIDRANLAQIEQLVGGESLRGRTGGAVTLAVGMARIFTKAMHSIGLSVEGVMKYWYHFAIMFEALFILTTIDAGTRIARFLLQEALGKVNRRFAKTDWLPGAILATGVVTAGWGILVATGSIDTIWPMFGVANQLLAVVALALVTTLLVNHGRARYAPVTLLPMLFVCTTTLTAGSQLVTGQFPALVQAGAAAGDHYLILKGTLSIAMTLFVIACVAALLLMAVSRWLAVLSGAVPVRAEMAGELSPVAPTSQSGGM
jgi:carbon starvation protein